VNDLVNRLPNRVVVAIVATVTLVGFLLRLNLFGDSVFGDELSTLWIVQNHGFTETVSVVHSDAEITPPLYFLLAWLTTHLGSSPELVRLPALIAGTAAIPMSYLFGLRTIGRATGLLAALVMALSPYPVFLSSYGRGYALMIFFLLAATLALLAALRTARIRWWVGYALCCCLAMYSHYTAFFVLAAQFLWVLWAHPPFRKAALLAAAGATILYLPWITGTLNDLDSPTQAILEFLQGDGLEAKARALAQWLSGEPMVDLSRIPGRAGFVLLAAGLLTGLAGTGLTLWRQRGRTEPDPRFRLMVLVVVTALAAPAAEIILLAFGTDIFSDRNLSAGWAGLPVLAAGLLTLPPVRVSLVATILAVGGMLVAAVRVSDRDVSGSAYEKAAGFIAANARPGDVVLDSSHYTPVPLTQLDAYLQPGLTEFRPGLAEGPPPFIPLKSVVQPEAEVIREAFRKAGTNRVFAVSRVIRSDDANLVRGTATAVRTPAGWKVGQVRSWPGFVPLKVTVFVPDGARSAGPPAEPEGKNQADHGQAEKEGGDLGAGD